MSLAGLPPTTVQGSTSLKTAARAPTTAPWLTVTPILINASAPTQTWSSKIIGAVITQNILFFHEP